MSIAKIVLAITLMFVQCSLGLSQNNDSHSERSIIVNISDQHQSNQIDITGKRFNNAKVDELNALFSLIEVSVLNPKSGSTTLRLTFGKSNSISKIISEYAATGYFDYVEPDYIGYAGGDFSFQPNDEFYDRQWSLNNAGNFELFESVQGADIDLERAWDITKGSEEIIIAILDTGLPFSHPEFEGRIWSNADESISNSDIDNNGYIDDTRGYDFANKDNDPSDDQGHGSNVAGIIGANPNNTNGYAGVNWHSKLMPLKILNNENYGFYSWWIEAIYYAVDNGAHVINMSVGGSSYSAGMGEALEYAWSNGVVIIACMMNENSSQKFFPAAYESTIAIGSTDPDDRRSAHFPWDFSKGSSYGQHIDLSAPGNYIYGLSNSNHDNFDIYWSGTSQAAPHVSGVVGLMLALNPDLEPEEVRTILRNTADDQVGRIQEDALGWDQYHGAGRLNAFNTLSELSTNTEDIHYEKFEVQNNTIHTGEEVNIRFAEVAARNIQLIQSDGQKVRNIALTSKHVTLNTNDLPAGIYYIIVVEKDKKYETQEIVIN